MPTKKVIKKVEPLHLSLTESSEVKSLAFPVSLCYENFNNQSLIDVELMQKVNGTIKTQTL